MNRKTVALILATILLGCSTRSVGADELPNEVDIEWPIFKAPMTITEGYDFAKDRKRASCVTFPTTSQQPRGDLSIQFTSDYDQVAKELGVEIGAQFRTAVMGGEASAKFAQKTKDTGYTVNLLYHSKSEYFDQNDTGYSRGDIKPRESFEDALKINQIDEGRWWAMCGTHYVAKVSHIASLLIKISVHFSSKEAAKKFEADVKGKYESGAFMAAAQAGMKSAEEHMSVNGNVEISALQIGGDPGLASQMLCLEGENGKIANCSQEAVACGAGDFKKCYDFLNAVLNYAGKNWPRQISKDNKPINYATNGVTLTPYYGTNTLFPAAPSQASIRLMEKDLQTLNAEFESYFVPWRELNDSNKLKTPRPNERQIAVVEAADSIFHEYLKRIGKGVSQCYAGGPSACSQAVDQMNADRKAAFEEINAKLAEAHSSLLVRDKASLEKIVSEFVKPETYAQFCDLADSFHPGIRWAVDSIMKRYESEFTPAEGTKVLDQCGMQQDRLADFEVLEIDGSPGSKAKAMDLRPIATLSNLKKLKVTNAGISNLEPILAIPNLEELDLSQNALLKICNKNQSFGLQNLRKITLRDNKLTDISCLTGEKLFAIDVRGNSDELVCPAGKSCRTEDLGKLLNHSEQPRSIDLPVLGVTAVQLDNRKTLLFGGLNRVVKPDGSIGDSYSSGIFECTEASCDKVADLEEPRAFASATMVNGSVVIAGGGTDSIEIYYPDHGFSHKIDPHLSVARSFHTATLLNGKIFFVGGYEGPFTSRFRQTPPSMTFDVLSDDLKSITPGNLQIGRAEHTATVFNNAIILIGGYGDAGMVDQTEVIHPNHYISLTRNMPRLKQARAGHVAFLKPGSSEIFIAGGFISRSKATDTIEIFDAKTLHIDLAEEHLTSARGGLAAVEIADDRWLFIGGTSSQNLTNVLTKCESVPSTAGDRKTTPASDSQTKVPTDDSECKAVVSGSTDKWKGADPSASAKIDIYDLKTNAIYAGSDLLHPRAGMAVSLVGANERHVLVSGGAGKEPRTRNSVEMIIYR